MVKLVSKVSVLVLSFFAASCGGQVKKYDWLASESAHQDFPMKIVRGTYLYPGEDRGLYVPNMKLIDYGWGKSVSVHVVGPDKKPLPDRLKITYYSYLEDKFYQGTFDLPYQEISRHFEEGYTGISDEHHIFREIVAGVAPGGQVAVWLQGQARSVEVFFGTADATDYQWDKFVDNPGITRKEYRDEIVADIFGAEKLAAIEEDGIPYDKFQRYRKHYNWRFEFFRMAVPKSDVFVEFLNGEKHDVFREDDGGFPLRERPIPQFLSFHSAGHLFLIRFDENEILQAFEEIANGDDPIYLDVAPGIPRSETGIRLRNKDDKHIMLEKFTVKEIK